MTTPKRYDPVIYGDEGVVDDGPYVKWEDYERLTRERDEWAAKWHKVRAELAELKYPGMKGVIRPLASTSHEPCEGLYLKALQKIILLSHEFNSERNAYAAKLEQIAHDAVSAVNPGGST